jgi:hypothetical protein
VSGRYIGHEPAFALWYALDREIRSGPRCRVEMPARESEASRNVDTASDDAVAADMQPVGAEPWLGQGLRPRRASDEFRRPAPSP